MQRINLKKGQAKYAVIFSFLIVSSGAWAGSGAIWPFNTPTVVANQICKSAANQAEHWADNKMNADPGRLSQVLQTLNSIESQEIAEDPDYANWTRIHWSLIRETAYLVWKNPNVGGSEAARIASNYCNNKKEGLKKLLEATNPK